MLGTRSGSTPAPTQVRWRCKKPAPRCCCSPTAAATAAAAAACAALRFASLSLTADARLPYNLTLAGLRFIYDRKTIEDEILGSRTDAQACGLPEGAVQGFRTPYLATSPTVREVLSKGGFR